MDNSRVKKTSNNIIWLAIYQIVAFISNLILPRLIITRYGSAYNGMVSSITQFLGFISILRLGIAGATRVSLYKSLAEEDNIATSAIVNASEQIMKRIGYVLIVYIAVLAITYPIIVDGEYRFFEIFLLVIAIGMGTFAQYFFGLTYQTLLAADQRQYISNAITTITVILNTALSVALILAGFSIQIVKIASGSLFFISPYILSRIVIKKYRIDKTIPPNMKALEKRKDAMGHSIANIIHENTDMVVLTLFSGVQVVSVYSVYALVMNDLRQVLEIFTNSGEAVFGNMWAKGEFENVKKNLNTYEFIICCFVSVVFSVTALLILPFVSLYTNGVTDIQYVIPLYACIVVLAQIFYCIRVPYLTLVQAAGKYKETKNGAYIEAAVNLSVSIVLVKFIGISGVAIGTLLANMIRTIQYEWFIRKHMISRGWLVFLKRLLWIALNVLLTVVCGYWFTIRLSYVSWSMWIITGVILVFISALICCISSYVFYKDDMKEFFLVAKRLIRRR